ADQILKVEIIPSPPANFDAEGNVSIVKIYLKKAIDPGLRANLKFDFFQSSYPGLLYSGNFDIKRKKSSFWFSYSGY
ncbi:hypothetical protein ACP3WF_24350, partial [Salmonella enterica]|uniref:hypothetical protein n=1 Tax=Salmonella enterica TaxID=28901 RepID=UPI003CF2D451